MARHSLPVDLAQYAAVRTVSTLLHSFDTEENLHTAGALGSLFCRLNRRRRRRAEDNIARSFPELSPQRVADVAEASMQFMFQLFLVDAPVMGRLFTRGSWPRRIRLNNLGPLIDQLIAGRPTILVTGHCGNWELLGHVFALLGYGVHALARPLDNRFLNRWIMGLREAQGTRIITKWGATPLIRRLLAGGGRVAFIADQDAGEDGLFVPFFGRLASSYKSIGLLAMYYDVPIVAGAAHRARGMEYELTAFDFIRPSDWKDQPDPLFYITARYNRAIEEMVRRAPEQYLWVHRRWKTRPRHEREGKPFPRRLLEHLRALPWMTEEELSRILARSERDTAEAVRSRPSPILHP